MALGTLSSLGLGSKVLNHDVIDKLREADETSFIKPIDKKIEQNIEKQTELIAISSAMRELKSNVSKLADYSTYLGRSNNVIGNALKANISSGVPTQDIKIDIESIATNDINEVGGKYGSRESVFTQKDATLRFHHKGQDYKVEIKAGMQLDEVAQLITDTTKGEVVGMVMKTGGDKPYQLMMNSKETGADSRIYFGSTAQGAILPRGAFELNDGELSITLKDKNGNDKTLNITLPQTSADSSSQDNAKALRDAVEEAIRADSDFAGLLESDLHIGVGGENSDRLTINDRRGHKISIKGTKSSELGFDEKIEPKESAESSETKESEEVAEEEDDTPQDLITSNVVGAGKLAGTINVGSIPLDLATLTSAKNSSLKNAKNIAEAINNIAGMYAVANESGQLVLNSDTGEMNIVPNDDEISRQALADLGIKEGITKMSDKPKKSKDKADSTTDTKDTESTEESEASKEAKESKEIESSEEYTSDNGLFKIRNVQRGDDARFSYNGINMTRATNNIDDIATGVNIELLTPTKPNEPAIISIKRNDEEIVEALKKFTESFNDLSLKLDEVTRYDEDSNIAGVFNGTSDVRDIYPSLARIFATNIRSESDIKSLARYGLALDEKGKMSFDASVFLSEIAKDPESIQTFFSGTIEKPTEYREVVIDGVFKKFDYELDRFLNRGDGRLKMLEDNLTREDKKLREDKKRAKEHLDARYDVMAQRFATYDSQIAKVNNSFNSVQLMIDQSIARK